MWSLLSRKPGALLLFWAILLWAPHTNARSPDATVVVIDVTANAPIAGGVTALTAALRKGVAARGNDTVEISDEEASALVGVPGSTGCGENIACARKLAVRLRAAAVLASTVSGDGGRCELVLVVVRASRNALSRARLRFDCRTTITESALRQTLGKAFSGRQESEEELEIPVEVPAPAEPPAEEKPPPLAQEAGTRSLAAEVAPAPVPPPPPPAPVANAGPLRRSMALVGVIAGEGVTPKEQHTAEELLLTALDHTGRFKMVGRSDFVALLEFDRQKRLLGCDDDSCMTEIAGALGVDFVASADIGRLNSLYILNLKVIDTRTTNVVSRGQVTVSSPEQFLMGAEALANQASASMPRTPAELRRDAQRTFGIVTLSVAGAALLAGAALIGTSQLGLTDLRKTARPGERVTSSVDGINLQASSAVALLSAGGVATFVGSAFVIGF